MITDQIGSVCWYKPMIYTKSGTKDVTFDINQPRLTGTSGEWEVYENISLCCKSKTYVYKQKSLSAGRQKQDLQYELLKWKSDCFEAC